MKKEIFFTLFILVFLIPINFSLNDPDYGEDDTYLGNIVDSYLNDDNINITEDVEHNSSLGCMELVEEEIGGDVEDFSLYTEVDIGANRLQFVSDTHIRHMSYRNEETYMYEDYGAKTFFMYDITFETYVDSEQGYARGMPFMLSNNTGGQKRHFDNNWGHTYVFFYRSSSPPRRIHLGGWNSSGGWSSSKDNYPLDQWLYIRVRQNATHTAMWVYNDEAHTDLWWYTDIPFFAEFYSKVYCANGYKTTGAWLIDYYVKNMILFEGIGYYDGYYTTINMLEEDRGLALLYNASLPELTEITMELSKDDINWVNHNDVIGHDTLVDGFEAIDLRDLNTDILYIRFNMSTIDKELTPRMYQVRLVTIIGEVENGGEGIDNTPSIILGIFLILVACALIYGVTRRR